MSRLRVLLATLVVGVLAVTTAAPATADHGAGVDAPIVTKRSQIAAAKADTPSYVVKKVNLVYKGSQKKPTTTKSANIPGIGDVDIYCRANTTMIRLYTANRQYETQMWTQKYEQKGYDSVAVKNARIYRYAHADDDGTGGTGFYTNEGFNQQSPPETFSKGYMNGIISQRSSRKPGFAAGQLSSPKPVTTFELTWYWENLREPAKYRYCKVSAVFTTILTPARRMDLTWHGNAQADGRDAASSTVPNIGTLDLSCTAGTDQDKTLTITPTSPTATLYVERVTGEGAVGDHVEDSTQDGVDPETGAFTPVPLPSNGTLRFRINSGGFSRWFLLSSYIVTNDRWGPNRNLCEVSVGDYNATFS